MDTKLLEYFHIEQISKGHTPGHKVMILMHGLGDSLESYKVLAREINVTGLHYLLVNAPKKYYFGYSWYDIPPADPFPGIENSSDIIVKIVKELNDQGYEHSDIFIAGFSQGGCISLETLYKLDKPIAGVAALSPRIYTQRWPQKLTKAMQETPVFCAHGKQDPVIPFNETQAGIDHLNTLGTSTVFKGYEMQHEIDPDEIRDLRQWLNERL